MTQVIQSREDRAVAAMLYAYTNSCKRSEGRGKWSTNDQRSHEKLRDSLVEFLGEDLLRTSVMQICATAGIALELV